jgi:hypothetical protein
MLVCREAAGRARPVEYVPLLHRARAEVNNLSLRLFYQLSSDSLNIFLLFLISPMNIPVCFLFLELTLRISICHHRGSKFFLFRFLKNISDDRI